MRKEKEFKKLLDILSESTQKEDYKKVIEINEEIKRLAYQTKEEKEEEEYSKLTLKEQILKDINGLNNFCWDMCSSDTASEISELIETIEEKIKKL